ncbi:MAG: SOS response-associated peptidase family protein [Steroidobacteraceae bacterium]
MCYSARILEAYRSYIRETGAEMDIEQFEEIYGARRVDSGIRIPRAVDRWFDDPQTAKEDALRRLVQEYRASKAGELEQEIFTQKRRLADAERKLTVKETKAALESKRIAADKIGKCLGNLPLYTGNQPTQLDGRIFPFHYAPIVVNMDGKNRIKLARYHLRQPGKPASIDRQFPGLYNARRDNLTKFWRGEFGHTHALMLVESFYENVDRGGSNAVLHFLPKPVQTMLVACLFAEWSDGKGGRLFSFAAITDEPPGEVAAAGHDRMIINIKPENVDRWLTPEGRSAQELQDILGDRQLPYYEHEVLAA